MIHRRILPFVCLLATLSLSAQKPGPLPATEVIRAAVQTAAKTHKRVFVIFHASWCSWCHRMDSIMGSPVCRPLFNSRYIITHLDLLESPDKKMLENPGAEALLQTYHGGDQGIPYWLILDQDGKLLADSRIKPAGADTSGHYPNCGCPDRPEEIAYFIRVLKETSDLSGPELALIGRSFTRK